MLDFIDWLDRKSEITAETVSNLRGSGQKALVYLGRYLYRGVIQEKDILRCADGRVSFRYRDAKTGRMEVRTLSGAAFLWLLLHLVLKLAPSSAQMPAKLRPVLQCPCCGAAMQIVRRRMCPAEPAGRAPDGALAGVAML